MQALSELAQLLKLPKAPDYIEAYDISNTAGSDNVAGMVVFKDARPFKSAYKKFKIKGFLGQDDYRSMAEVLGRRFEEYKTTTFLHLSSFFDFLYKSVNSAPGIWL